MNWAWRFSIENPYLLPLLVAGLFPVVLHWLDRRRARVVEWAAVRFLVPRNRGRVRRLQRLEGLLILVRSLLALAIAAALLRPFLLEERSELEELQTPRTLGIVIDNSYSMALRESEDGPSSLEKAKEAALTLLDDSAPDSRALLSTAASVESNSRNRPGDLETVRKAIQEVQLDGGTFDILGAIDSALEPLLQGERLPRELYVLTDLQKSTALGLEPDRLRFLRERLNAVGGPIRVCIVDCGTTNPSNHFVAEFAQEPLASDLDTPLEITGTVEASGAPLMHDEMTLRLIEQGRTVELLQAKSGPDKKAKVTLVHKLSTPLEALLTLEAPHDLLREDDSRRLVVEVLDRLPVLIVGKNSKGGGAGTSRFVDLALAPRAGDFAAPPLVFRPILATDISALDLESSRVVIVTGLARLGDAATSLLDRFVRKGGGLLVFAGTEFEATEATQDLFRGGRGVLPAGLSPRTSPGAATGVTGTHPRDIALTHPVLKIFTGPEGGDLSRVTIRSWTRTTEVARDSVTLANIEPGTPWILERKVGLGRTLLVTTSASLDDTDLPSTPLFLPLVHRLTRYLAARDPAGRTLRVGQPIRWPLPADFSGGEVSVLDPARDRSAAEIILEDGHRTAIHRQTRLPGFYELSRQGPAGTVTAHFALNVLPEESRVERVAAVDLSTIETGLGAQTLQDVREAARSRVTRTAKRELWPCLLAFAILCFFGEQMLSRIFVSRRATSC